MFHDDKQFSFFLSALKFAFNYIHFYIYTIVVVFQGVNSIYSQSHAFIHASNHDLAGGEKKRMLTHIECKLCQEVRSLISALTVLTCEWVRYSSYYWSNFFVLAIVDCCWVLLSFKICHGTNNLRQNYMIISTILNTI